MSHYLTRPVESFERPITGIDPDEHREVRSAQTGLIVVLGSILAFLFLLIDLLVNP